MKRNLLSSLLTICSMAAAPLSGQDQARMIYDQAVEFAINGQFESARNEFQNVLEIDTLYVPARLNLVVVNDVLSQKIAPQAARHYFTAIRYGNLDRFDEKISELNTAISLQPAFGLAYNERGIARARKQEFSLAIDDYNQALKLLPDYPEVYFNKALSCDNAERYPEANAAYRKFLEYTPADYTWYIIYARKRIWEMENPSPSDAPEDK